jgi:hypothetical protein
MLAAAGDTSIEWLTDLCNDIVREGRIPSDWQKSVLIPVYKGKGDPMDCGSYRAIKLLEHAMKTVERVFERRIRKQVKIDDMQMGFMPGKGTTDAIFILRQLQEKHQAKNKKLFYAFVDLEKAYDRVPREVTRWAMRQLGVEEWLVASVMAMYEGAQTVVRTGRGDSESFEVKVGLHQGSVLSPLLFVIVIEAVTRGIREGLPWEILYADDLVLMATTEEELKRKIQNWKTSMANKGLKVNPGKTKEMIGGDGQGVQEESGKWPCGVCHNGVGRNSIRCNKCQKWIHKKCSGEKGRLQTVASSFVCKTCQAGASQKDNTTKKGFDIGNGVVLERVGKFCYLGDTLNADGGSDLAITTRIRCAWKKFRELTPILAAKRLSLRLKRKVYESCVRTCMTYGSETWVMKRQQEVRLERTEMKMIRWMCGVSLMEKNTNVKLRERIGIKDISTVCREKRLRWLGHVERKDNLDWTKRCMTMAVEGKRPRGRPRRTWEEVVNEDMKRAGLKREDAKDRERWRRAILGGSRPTQTNLENRP